MMGNPRCHWVRDRLPLLVGNDLRGIDRRRVERHLIGCPQCRQHQSALGQSLKALRAVAITSPVAPDAPSLWPALSRQIRESRRPSAVPTLVLPTPFAPLISWLRLNPWPAFGLGLALLTTATVMANLHIRQKNNTAKVGVAVNARPIMPVPTLPRITQAPTLVSDSHRELSPPLEPSSTETRHDYDLDFGRPMPPADRGETRDTRLTY
jgi:hypothetical protein